MASLPWYDLPANRDGIDSMWSAMRRHLESVGVTGLPTVLERSLPLELQWADPSLLVSQCCWPDLNTDAGSRLTPLAVPVLSGLDCEPGHYYSFVVSRRGETPGPEAKVAINSPTSHSGNGALRGWLAANGMSPTEVMVTGSHSASVEAVAEGHVDLAAIDAFTWSLFDPPSELEIIDTTKPVLAPPWVTSIDCDIVRETVVESLEKAVSAVGVAAGIEGLVPVAPSDRRA